MFQNTKGSGAVIKGVFLMIDLRKYWLILHKLIQRDTYLDGSIEGHNIHFQEEGRPQISPYIFLLELFFTEYFLLMFQTRRIAGIIQG